jgi:hypothetical protein
LCSRLTELELHVLEDRLLGLHYHFTETKAQYKQRQQRENTNRHATIYQDNDLLVDNPFTLLSTLLQAKTKTRGSSILALSIGTPETQRRMTAFCVNIMAQNNWQAII